MHYIQSEFSKIPLNLTPDVTNHMRQLVIGFETRGTHALALNSPLLGVHKLAFVPSDKSAFFSVLGVAESLIRETVKRCPSINPEFNVISDPLNLLAIWAIHRAHVTIKNPTARRAFQIDVAKFLHYKFFGSVVNVLSNFAFP